MKWQTLALAFLSSTGLASPIAQRDASKIYTLRLKSKITSLNGKYLGVNGTLVGVYNKDTPAAAAVHFYPVPAATNNGGLVELHRHPVGIVDHALALLGSEDHGLLDLTDVVSPETASFPKGTKCDWTSFTLDAEDKTVDYAGSKDGGSWVAFPLGSSKGDWSVKWKGADAITIQTFMPVDLVYEEVAPHTHN